MSYAVEVLGERARCVLFPSRTTAKEWGDNYSEKSGRPTRVIHRGPEARRLKIYFNETFVPTLAGKSERAIGRYRTAVNNLAKYNGNDVPVERVTPLMLARFGQWLRERGVTEEVAEKYQRYIRAVVRHAIPDRFPKGASLNRGTKVVYRRNSLLGHFDKCYAPAMAERFKPATLHLRRSAILKLCAFAGRDVTLGEVDPDLIRRFVDWCLQGLSKKTVVQYVAAVLFAYRHADPEGYAARAGQWTPTAAIPDCEELESETNGQKRVPELSVGDAPEGSLMRFLHRVYLPYKIDMAESSAEQLHITVSGFDRWNGRRVMLADLSDDLLLGYMGHRREQGLSPKTINGDRANILCLWRHAWRKRLVEEQPRDVPRLKEPYRVPEAWTLEDVGRLLKAAAETPGVFRNGVPKAPFWRAYVLVGWEIGARLGDMLALPMAIVADGGKGVISIQKTGVEQLIELSPETMAAVMAVGPPNRKFMFPWPYRRETFHEHFRALVARAGFEPSRRNGSHKLRRTSASYVEAVAPGMATYHLGHRTADLARRNYIDPRIAKPRNIAALLPRPVAPE